MGWKLSCPMDEKKEFIEAWLSREFTFSDLCEEFGVSRKTGYKFLARFKAGGMAGLEELSRRPRSHPATTGEEAAALIREMRGRHPTEGAVTLLERIRRKSPGIELPSPSTAHEILRRGGLVGKRRPRRFATPTMPGAMAIASSSNHVLSIDFKGDFCMGNGQRCYPLTLTDNYSRFLLRCVGMANQSRGYDEVRAVMEACFLEYGLPSMIRSDNGPPFASTGLNGWSKLSVWWTRLGNHSRTNNAR